jgi:hypothetical protein
LHGIVFEGVVGCGAMSLFAALFVVTYVVDLWVTAISFLETLQLWTWFASAMGAVIRGAHRYALHSFRQTFILSIVFSVLALCMLSLGDDDGDADSTKE